VARRGLSGTLEAHGAEAAADIVSQRQDLGDPIEALHLGEDFSGHVANETVDLLAVGGEVPVVDGLGGAIFHQSDLWW